MARATARRSPASTPSARSMKGGKGEWGKGSGRYRHPLSLSPFLPFSLFHPPITLPFTPCPSRAMSEPSRLTPTTNPRHGRRTHTCGALRSDDVGREVVLKGWVDTKRNLGGLVFAEIGRASCRERGGWLVDGARAMRQCVH